MRTSGMVGLGLLLGTAAGAAVPPVLGDYARVSTGSFTSARQAAADARYDVVEVEVRRIWPERDDALWLYQEQAIVGGRVAPPGASKERPYFQRVAKVVRLPDGTLRRDNYSLREPARFVGYGRRAGVAPPTPADLFAPGCHNIVEPVAAGHFVSRTEGCANRYKGAAGMKAVGTLNPDGFANWDRGFDAHGRHVWGPVEGGYVFDRISAPLAGRTSRGRQGR